MASTQGQRRRRKGKWISDSNFFFRSAEALCRLSPFPCTFREVNLMKWKCFIPGKDDTLWAGGFYPLTMTFTEDYPAKPPKVRLGSMRSIRCKNSPI